jgi:glycosyltransferase involved in cell wall biosynthesis
MMRLLFVVHRYAPYPGGSETNTQNMAEEMLRRGLDVTVLAHEHKGDLNGVKVTSDYQILGQKFDLIVVHGGDVISQNIVHLNADRLPSKVFYLIVKPSESDICLKGLREHEFVGYGTSMDVDLLRKYGLLSKGRRIRYGMRTDQTIAQKVHKSPKTTFVSAGGYYPHKAMIPLAKAFEESDIDAELHLYGYIEGALPAQTDRVKVFFGLSKEDVMQAIASADAYIMNSYEEGYGLVLLEAMMNKTPWIARNIAAAKDLSSYGSVYESEKELIDILRGFKPDQNKIDAAYNYAMSNHTVRDMANDIEDVLLEVLCTRSR